MDTHFYALKAMNDQEGLCTWVRIFMPLKPHNHNSVNVSHQ